MSYLCDHCGILHELSFMFEPYVKQSTHSTPVFELPQSPPLLFRACAHRGQCPPPVSRHCDEASSRSFHLRLQQAQDAERAFGLGRAAHQAQDPHIGRKADLQTFTVQHLTDQVRYRNICSHLVRSSRAVYWDDFDASDWRRELLLQGCGGGSSAPVPLFQLLP